MKRYILTLVFLLICLQMQGQTFVQAGDTGYLWGNHMYEYYRPHKNYAPYNDTNQFLCHGYIQFTTTEEVIHGLAIISPGYVVDPRDNQYVTVHMKVYQKTSSGYSLLDSVPITRSAIEQARLRAKRFLYTPHPNSDDSSWYSRDLNPKDVDEPLLEFYFSHPVTVVDTFYVGFVYENAVGAPYPDCNRLNNIVIFNYNFDASPTIRILRSTYTWQDPSLWYPPLNGHGRPAVFPILTPLPIVDTIPPCPAPDAPELIDTAIGSATLQWQCTEDSCQLHLTAPGVDTLIANNSQLITLCTPGVTYTATLRSFCHHVCTDHDTIVPSPWSAALTFRVPARDTVWNTDTLWINDTTGVIGGELVVIDSNANIVVIDGQTYIILGTDTIDYNDPRLIWIDDHTAVLGGTLVVLSTQDILSPNSSAILREEYHDLLGRRLAQPPAHGLYLLRTVTTNGTTIRKIIKQ